MTVRFEFDWFDSGSSPDRLSELTMAELRITADKRAITAVVDRLTNTYRESVIIPLFNIADWLVANWCNIRYEVADMEGQDPEFASRHNLAWAGSGFALPELTITPASETRMQLKWVRSDLQYAQVAFLQEGSLVVEREELEAEFRKLIDAVLNRLQADAETAVAAEDLSRNWSAINNLDDRELEFSRAAALFGVDPFDVEDHVAELIIGFWNGTDASVREDALAVARGLELTSITNWLEDARRTVQAGQRSGEWPRIRQGLQLPTLGPEPWTWGYETARAVREGIGANGCSIDLDNGPLAIPYESREVPTARLHGLVGADTPQCVVARRRQTGTRFLQARALGDFLGRPTAEFGLLSSVATDSQARARAFAAEFLAPSASLDSRISTQRVDSEQIDDLAHEFLVSSEVIRRQIQNHRIAEIISY